MRVQRAAALAYLWMIFLSALAVQEDWVKIISGFPIASVEHCGASRITTKVNLNTKQPAMQHECRIAG
jgi:hypothetical protein